MSNEWNRNSRRSQDFTPFGSISSNPYRFASLTYPEDIHNLSHALLFNINVQESSKDMTSRETKDVVQSNFGGAQRESRSNQIKAKQGLSSGLTRRTKRVLRAISLYVPDTIVFDNKQEYQSPSLMEMVGLGGTAMVEGAERAYSAFRQGTTGQQAVAGITGVGALFGAALAGRSNLQSLGNLNQKATGLVRTGAQLAGYALNPIIEVLYQAPSLRTFNFDFNFISKSSNESDQIAKIIYEFRRHSAPEFVDATQGIFLLPPSDFDITFLRKDSSGAFIENTNFPRISTCVLEDVQVDYAASGQFVTFADGMPVQIRMRLQFKELNLITRERIDEGY